MSTGPPRYRFGPRSTRGLIAGWRGGQIAVVAAGALFGLGFMRTVGGIAGVALALLVAGGGVAVATWPVAGRPAESWAPTVARFAIGAMADGRTAPWRPGTVRHRGALSRLQLQAPQARSFAVVEDPEAGTWSAAVAVGSPGYALYDEDGKADAVAAWSGVLAAMAAESRALHRLQWIARTRPCSRAGPLPEVRASQAAAAYGRLVAEVSSGLCEREVVLVLTTRLEHSRLSTRAGARARELAGEQLSALLGSLCSRLRGAGLVPGEPLGESELAASIQRCFEREPSAVTLRSPWPVGVEARWSSLRTDATCHASYWISEWPRGEVGPGVLLPLLIGGSERRSVSLTLAPLPPVSAVRRAERERTAGAADADLRRRHGFSLTARARAEQEVRLQREAELADGHAAYLFSGYVTVTAGDEGSLERSCAEVEQSAALSRLEIRRLYGAQEEGFVATLPVGRGCG